MEKELVCINCPMGCRLSVTIENDKVSYVTGNACLRGAEYARQEAVCPMRMLTSLMFTKDGKKPFSVKSLGPVPKLKLLECAREILKTRPAAPISCGDVVIYDICCTGVNIIATRDAE